MKRDLAELERTQFDVLVVGAGAHGAFTSLECARRGLKTALVDKADFCGATSANSLKIIHGGLRYLQQADIVRVRQSMAARRAFLHSAPHLVSPLPCALPTGKKFTRRREVMAGAMLANDILTADRNIGLVNERYVKRGRIMSRADLTAMIPDMDRPGITGAAVWTDACAYSTERIIVGAVRAAAERGAAAANYLSVVGAIRSDGQCTGVRVRDACSGNEFDIRAKLVINNTGPWAREMLDVLGGELTRPPGYLAMGLNVVLKQPICSEYAIAVDLPANNTRPSRSCFFVPWRGLTMAGTYYRSHHGAAGALAVREEDISVFLQDLSLCWPERNIGMDDVVFQQAGLLPSYTQSEDGVEPRLYRHAWRCDHREDGVDGLLTVQGIKYTTAWTEAGKTASMAVDILGTGRQAPSDDCYLPGGQIEGIRALEDSARKGAPDGMSDKMLSNLVQLYGSECENVLPEPAETDDSETPTIGEVRNAVENEMALTLSDLVFRRTGLGTAGLITQHSLQKCAESMGTLLGWDHGKVESEAAKASAVTFSGQESLDS